MQYSAATAQEFHDNFGVLAIPLAEHHNTAFKLTKALRGLDPPVYVTDQVAKTWLAKFWGQTRIQQASQIEAPYYQSYYYSY